MEQSQFIALSMSAFQLFRAIVPIDTGNMRYNATRYVQHSDAVEIRVDARTAPRTARHIKPLFDITRPSCTPSIVASETSL